MPLLLRLAATVVLVGGYYWFQDPVAEYGATMYQRFTGNALEPGNRAPRILAVTCVLAALVAVWWRLVKTDPRFQAPLLVTTILALGDAAFGILESHTSPQWLMDLTGGRMTSYSPTFMAIVATVVAETILGRFFWGKWPHLASGYISGISTGILIKSPELWPFVLCGLISITSKYVLRNSVSRGLLLLQLALVAVAGYFVVQPKALVPLLGADQPNTGIVATQLLLSALFLILGLCGTGGTRHLWNPTNFGVSMMLFLAPASVASLSVQAGNNGWSVLVIWLLGGMIMYRLGLWHIPLTFIAAFVPLSVFRSFITGDPWETEVAPITSPMFQLYIFFMITDPKTIVRGKTKQIVVVLLVAVMETFLRLAFKDIYSLFHALFIVGPAANLAEIYFDRKKKAAAAIKAVAESVARAEAKPGVQPAEALARN
jgi:hypothetical protein